MTDDADISYGNFAEMKDAKILKALSKETKDFIEQDEIIHPVKIMRKKMKEESDMLSNYPMRNEAIKNMKFTSSQKPEIDIVDTKPKETCAKGLHEGDPKLSELQADESSYIHEHLETLRMLTVLTRPNSIVEIGTGRGDSTLAFAEGLAMNGKGHIISLDIKTRGIAVDTIWDEDLMGFVTFLQMDSLSFAKKSTNMIDILFIDGLHTYKQVKQELELYKRYIEDEGFIILHDTNNYAHPGVYKAVQEFLGNGDIGEWTFFEYYHCNGLTILRHDVPDG